MAKKPTLVSPAPRYADFVHENLGLVDVDSDNLMGGSVEERFRAGADINEGVSGLKAIDTTYENTSEDIVDRPRNLEAPRPMDLGRYPHRRY